MTTEEQRIAIAEACGWTFDTDGIPTNPQGTRWGVLKMRAVPEYLHDLNACRWMESVLNEDQKGNYVSELANFFDAEYGEEFDLVHATAPQRCEAFLRTIGKWKEKV